MARVPLCLLALILLSPAKSIATPLPQAEAAASRLASVAVTGSTHFTSQLISPFTGLTVGAMVTRGDLQSGADHLAALGCFANVQYKFSSSPAGVSVEYAVSDAPEIPVEFDNFIWLSDAELAAGLAKSGILFDGRAPDHGAILDAMSSDLEKLLDERGVHAQVAHELVQDPDAAGPMQQFRVEGLNLTVSGLQITDSLATSSLEIQQRQQDIVGKPYSRVRLELFEQEQVLPLYRSHAYLQAAFGPPSARVTSTPGSPEPSAIIAVINVKPGPAYKWGGVVWQGSSVLPTTLLDGLVNLKPGDLADGVQLQGLWLRVQDLYLRHGFLDASVAPKPQFDAGSDRVTFNVQLHDGPQYHMRNLILTGLSVEGERRIRAGWPIPEGNIFDESAYDDFLATGIPKAFAGLPFHYTKVGRFLDKHPDTAQVDVLIDFQ